MKVLHLIDSGGLYGAEKMLLALVSEQVKLGLQPMILSVGSPGIEEKALEVEACRLKLPITPWRMKPGFNPFEAMAIIQWAKSEKYDLFHSHGYKFNVLIGLLPNFLRRLPLVATLHGYVKAKKFSKSWVYEHLDRLALGHISHVVLVADAIKKDIPKRLLSSDRVSVIPNGLDVAALEHEARKPLPRQLSDIVGRHRPLILAVGRLSQEKGFDRLIAALKTVKTVHSSVGLVIIGEGDCRVSLERQVEELDLGNTVYLPGYCRTVPALMSRSDLLCIPSRTEGLPITLLEGMAVGVPICATDVGEIRTALGDCKGGIVNGLGSAEELAEGILHSFSEENETEKSVAWSRIHVEKTYSAWSMARNYADIYQSVLR